MLSPIAFEQQQKLKLKGSQETRGHSVRITTSRLITGGLCDLEHGRVDRYVVRRVA